jgi:heat shock protein HtpX
MKRILLFILTNILVLTLISIIFAVTGLGDARGGGYMELAVICLVWGSVGSFISLMMSKWMAKVLFRLEPVDEHGEFGYLIRMTEAFARQANISPPEVFIYPSDELNAFATGPTRNNSLVAFSEGLLREFNQDEVEGVLAHEVSHVANGDMVTMALVQGVVNAFVMFISRVVASAINSALRNNQASRGLSRLTYRLLVSVLQIFFGLLTAPVVAAFSRAREYRADAGGAKLAGSGKMIAALQALQERLSVDRLDDSHPALKTMKISGGGVSALFSTHPPLEDRINALKQASGQRSA